MCTNFYKKNIGFDFTKCFFENNQYSLTLAILNITKGHLFTPLLIEGFPAIPRMQQKAPCFERFQCDKENKQTNNLP
jgi:hypothetical protein